MAETVEALARLKDALAYDPETGVFIWRRRVAQRTPQGAIAGCLSSTGYWQIRFERAEFKAHRLAWAFIHGAWPTAHIDHINGDRRDNRGANLRDVDQAVNAQNRRAAFRSNASSGLLGVSFNKSSGKYMARVHHQGRNRFVGEFATASEAHSAYVAAKRELHAGCTL